MDRLKNILAKLKHLDLEDDIEQKETVVAGLGGTCDVYKAWSRKHQKMVAVKCVRVLLRHDEKFAKKLAREIQIWAALEHECVLPFLGYFVEGENAMPSLISLWMVNGTLDIYMMEFPRGDEKSRAMLMGIAGGLGYLHSRSVIHADLKSKNILISDDCKPMLADFGLSDALTFSKGINTTTSVTGTVKWMAVELLDREPPVHTRATDVWAYGMVAYELLSGIVPYGNRTDARVLSLILSGKHPDKPENEDGATLFEPLWQVCESCWNSIPEERPTAEELSSTLSRMAKLSADLNSDIPCDDGHTMDGRTYYVMNIGWERWLDLTGSDTTEGNSIIVHPKNSPPTPNQLWNFRGSFQEFTLQNVHALKSKGTVGGGLEGHLRTANDKSVLGRKRFEWSLECVGDNLYKFHPMNRPGMSLACLTSQPELVSDRQDKNQQWTFVEVPLTPLGYALPIDGQTYYIVNPWFERWLDLADSDPTEGHIVINWFKNTPSTPNQAWKFGGSLNEFTLQNVLALTAKGVDYGNSVSTYEGHIRVENEKTVIGRQPFKWKLESVANSLYRLHPVNRPGVSLTCVIDQMSVPGCTTQLQPSRSNDDTQHWAFIPASDLRYGMRRA